MGLSDLFGSTEEVIEDEPLEIEWGDMSGQTLLEEYPIREPHAYVRCTVDEETNRKIYHVGEPELSDRDREIIDQLVEGLGKTLDVKVDEIQGDPEEHLREAVDELLRGLRIELGPTTKDKIFYYVRRDFLGFGLIDVLMQDPNIEDISCDGADVPVFIYHRHHESMESTIQYESEEVLESFVIRLAQRAGQHISVADPLIDATLEDGSRAIISLGKEVTTKGSTYTIRKFREEPFTPINLIEFGTFSAQQMAYLWLAVEHGLSALVVGGTASGKTTTLNAMSLFIPHQMKIVSIEDTREINLPNPNWVPGATRSGFGGEEVGGKQVGEVDMFDLLKAALRQRPEYILVGEIRGEEAYVLFQAMSTGHTAYSTVHADSIQGLVHRLENKPIDVPRVQLPALDLVTIQIQTRISGERVRRCKEVVEIIGLDPNSKELLTNRAYRWDIATDSQEYGGKSYVLERIAAKTNMSQGEVWDELQQREEILKWMVRREINTYEEVGEIISKYYMRPERILDLVKRDVELERAEEVLSEIEVETEEDEDVETPPAAVVGEDRVTPLEEAGGGTEDYPEFAPIEDREDGAPPDERTPQAPTPAAEEAEASASVPDEGIADSVDAVTADVDLADDEVERIPADVDVDQEPDDDDDRPDVAPPTPESAFREKMGVDVPEAEELMEREEGEEE